jgi:glycosyltransferase involved in cell wall biosynthesis
MRRLDDVEMADLIAGAQALIVPGIEEFGITAVEAQAAGRPVLGVDVGGLKETVTEGETGVLVAESDATALAEALREVDFTRFDPAVLRANAERFDVERFHREMRRHVDRVVAVHVAGV